MKRIFSMLFSALVTVSLLCGMISYAAPRYAYTSSATSTLTVVSKTAHCDSIVNGNSNATKIAATQYLEKKNGSSWETVSGGTWSDSANKNSLIMSNSKNNLSSGTYRLRTVFKVYSGISYETFEKTSSEVIV